MEKDTAGALLGKALIQITEDIEEMLSSRDTFDPKELNKLTKELILDMNTELRKEKRQVLQSSLELLLLALANYSMIEKAIFKEAGINYSVNRKEILNKVYTIMSKDL